MPYAIRKRKIFIKTIKFYFLPPVRGGWQIVKTHYNQKKENHRNGVFDSSNEAFGCTGYNAKKPQLLKQYRCWKNQEKPQKKRSFLKKMFFWGVFLDFFSNCRLQRVEVFCVVISASRRFIWAIKHPRTMIFIFLDIMGFYNFLDPPYRG